MKTFLTDSVFPSSEQTIASLNSTDIYDGAHLYEIRNCLGFSNNQTVYDNSVQTLQFVQKLDDGSVIPGVQSEQLVLCLLDRTKKLNSRFPSEQSSKMIEGLEMFLDACQERVQDRLNRNVMGDLKK